MKTLFFIVVACFLFPMPAQAQSCTTASCSAATCVEATVLAAMPNSSAPATVVVTLPASCSQGWTSEFQYSVPSNVTNLTIQGSTTVTGSCASPPTYNTPCTATDNTVLIDNCSGCGSGPFIQITTSSASTYFRWTGITLQGGSGVAEFNGMLNVNGYSQNVRVDHNHFNSSSYSPANNGATLYFGNWLYGVTDHNVFDLTTSAINGENNGVHVNHETWNNALDNGTGEGDGSWADSTTFGSNRFIFIENNTFNYGYVNDCGGGGRFVMRYNYINESQPQTHPTQGGSERARGCRAEEIYGNYFSGSNSYSNGTLQGLFRDNSGTSLIWGNNAPAGYQTILFLYQYRYTGTSYGAVNTPNGWGACGTAYNGTNSNWDQNQSASTGYRCLDNPGVGKGDLLTGGFSADGSGTNNVTNNATGCVSTQSCAWPRQASEPIYMWLNSWTQASSGQSDVNNAVTQAFVANSDYYPYCSASNPAYYACTSAFNGTAGTGSGLLSARPSTCTVAVGYWATDTTTLYTCNTANTWTAYYTPYTYPHPLAGGATPTAPASAIFAASITINPKSASLKEKQDEKVTRISLADFALRFIF